MGIPAISFSSPNIVGAVGIFGLSTGIYGGLKQWLYWFSYHKPVKFANKKLSFLEPLANTSVISGKLIYEVFYHGIASALTAIAALAALLALTAAAALDALAAAAVLTRAERLYHESA